MAVTLWFSGRSLAMSKKPIAARELPSVLAERTPLLYRRHRRGRNQHGLVLRYINSPCLPGTLRPTTSSNVRLLLP